jgi:hypothetical protein
LDFLFEDVDGSDGFGRLLVDDEEADDGFVLAEAFADEWEESRTG